LYFFSPKGEYKSEGGCAQCNADKDFEWYKQQFVTDNRKKGEISTHYLFDPARNLRSLMKIIQEEPDNEIIARGLYARQLAPYMRQFSDDQLRVYLFDDMKRDPAAFFLDLFGFIGVDTSVVPSSLNKGMNKSRRTKFVFIPRFVRFVRQTLENIGLRRLVRAMIKWGVAKQYLKFHGRYNRVAVDYELPPDERASLYDCFAEDIEQLEQLLNRDLSHWKSPR